MNIGFALIVGSPLFEEIIELENNIHNEAGFYNQLGMTHNLPHTTIFQGSFTDEVPYTSIASDLVNYYKKYIKQCIPVFNQMVYIPEGWYFYKCNRTHELQLLHNYTCRKVRPYLLLDPNRLDRNVSLLSEDQIQGIKKYGYRYAGPAFCPHITIGRTDSEKPSLLVSLNTASKGLSTQIPFKRLTVYQMGPNGTHLNTLFEASL
jgi:hypothetical protein